jgi:hypothetical protein
LCPGDILFFVLAQALQSGSAAQLFGLPATCTGGGSWAVNISRILTLDVVLNVGAGQSRLGCEIMGDCWEIIFGKPMWPNEGPATTTIVEILPSQGIKKSFQIY